MKTALITGVSRGIGKALAEKFLSEGWFVIGTSTDGQMEWQHENLKVFPLDLAESESIISCAQKIKDFGKTLDILINNAATYRGVDEDPTIHINYLRETLEVNLIGTIHFTNEIISLLNDGGHLINISSRAGSLANTSYIEYPDYKIAKAGLNMFTRIFAMNYKDKFTVSSVHPGWVKTDMGGDDADIEASEAADDIYKLAISKPESGQFWFKGEKYPW